MPQDYTTITVKVGEQEFMFGCPPNSTLGQAYDAISTVKSYIIGRMQEVSKPQDPEKPPEKQEDTCQS